MLKILTDFTHADLFWSLDLLAKRLNAELYRPVGMQWFNEGYLKLYGNLRAKEPDRWIAKQYLEDTLFEIIPHRHQGQMLGRETYHDCEDYPLFNVLTLEEARKTQIDIVICTIHENEPYFAKLKEFWPNAKFIRHCGNTLDTLTDSNLYPNLLSSAIAPFKSFEGHKILYKQEFPLDLFKYEKPTQFKNIYSFQNDIEQFEETWQKWIDLKHDLREFTFKSYGVGNEDGKIYPKREYIKKMLESTFGFQSKGKWEGYGHTIFNQYCLGRPMILKHSDYFDKIAAPLLIQDETFLEMDDPELIAKIRYYSDPERYLKVSLKARELFETNVNFDKEFEQEIKPFFDNLI